MINIFYIFITELFIYAFFQDYSFYINRLSSKLASINILYVKIFQAFALNNSLIDDKINNELLRFTDHAPWNYSDMNLKELVEIAEENNLFLKHGYEVPINSGMISLVFKAYENNNLLKPVIIKMKRKNIEKKLNEAIDNLSFFMYIVSFIPIIHKYKLDEVVKNNIEIIQRQTNFLEEIDNMNKIRENCKNLKYIKIPTANRKVTEKHPNFILMEYIDGLKIDNVKKEDYDFFAKLVVKFGIVTTIMHGITHGDLHSGNILFIKDMSDTKYPHKLGIIDFGIIYHVNSTYKELLFDILIHLFENPPRETAEKLLKSGIIDPPNILQQIPQQDYDNILTFTEEIIYETIHLSKKANQIQIYKFISKLHDYLSKKEFLNIGIKPSDDFIKIQLVLAMAHGITLTLCNNDFITLIDKAINELFSTKILIH
jgi:ubiquinone biosynthesis protein